MICWLLRKEIGASRDEVLWEMPVTEVNLMLHSYYFMDGRETRRIEDRVKLHDKFDQILSMFRRK